MKLHGRVAFAAIFVTTFVACTLSQSLDYLTKGSDGAETGAPDGAATDAPANVDGEALPPIRELATNQRAPRRLVQDANNLYWANDDGAIMTLPKAGGTPREIAKSAVAGGIDLLAVDADPAGHVYVRAGTVVELFRVPKAGGALAKIAGGDPPIEGVLVDDRNLYLGRPDEFEIDGGVLLRAQKDGTNPVTLVTAVNPYAMALHEGVIVFNNTPVDENADYEMRAIAKDAVPGSPTQLYASSTAGGPLADSLEGIAVDKDAIYYVEGGVVYRLPRLQSTAPEKLAQGQDIENETRIAIDDLHVYVAEERTSSTLQRVVKTGGAAPTTIAVDLARPTSVVVDATAVYFTVLGPGTDTGKVLSIAK